MNLDPLLRVPFRNVEPAAAPPAATSGAPAMVTPRLDPATRGEVARVRAGVAECLRAIATKLEQRLGPAIEGARKAWEKADDLTIFDWSLGLLVSDTRRTLQRAAASPSPAVRAVALEGWLALDAACGLAGLCERRLSSLIRLRVRAGDGDLLPGGRPFIDLGPAIAELAREWS